MFITEATLSKHTVPGRLGFPHALEIEYCCYDADQIQRLIRLHQHLKKRLGNSYQHHWSRPQLRRQWCIHTLSSRGRWRRMRVCFADSRQLSMAQLVV